MTAYFDKKNVKLDATQSFSLDTFINKKKTLFVNFSEKKRTIS